MRHILLSQRELIFDGYSEKIYNLVDLLRVSTKDQLFQFNGQLYQQTDGVAMGLPLGPLLANVFMGSIEETLELAGKMPPFYKRYVDDTLQSWSSINTVEPRLTTTLLIGPPPYYDHFFVFQMN